MKEDDHEDIENDVDGTASTDGENGTSDDENEPASVLGEEKAPSTEKSSCKLV